MPNSISANYSQTNGERKVVDNPTTFLIGDGSNLKVGKVDNTAGAIGASGNGKLSIDEYIGHNLENNDETTTKGASLSLSPNKTVISGVGINYANKNLESVTKNTVIGNVEIGKSSGDEINKDLASMTEITKDKDTKTNVFVESQTIKYALNPESFKEDLQIALIEGKATGRTVVKTIDNIINGDKSQDIGEEERRSLIEIKEAIVRVQTAPAMDIIAKEDLADKKVQARLGVVIEKFDPNDSTLSEKVRERLDELKTEGKEIVAFYDKKTGKIFINQNAKDEEVRASIAREYKIKEDLELGRGKANDKGQLRSTVAGEIAYDEIKDRLKKGDKNPISASRFDVAKMDKDSEVTSDKYGEQVEGFENIAGGALKLSSMTSEVNDNPEMLDKDPETRKRLYQAGKEFNETYNKNIDYMIEGWHRPEVAKKEALILEKEIVKEKDPEMKNLLIARHGYLEREAHPLSSMGKSLFKGGVKGFVTTITIRLASKTAVGKAATLIVIGGKMVLDGINGAKEIEKIPISSKQANKMKRIAPEFYKSAEDIFKIEEKTDTSDTSLLGMAEDYYRNSQILDERLANDVGYVAGGYAASKGMDIAENRYKSYKASSNITSDVNKTVEVAKKSDIGLGQQEGPKHQNGQVSKNKFDINQGQKYVSNEGLGQQNAQQGKIGQNNNSQIDISDVGNKQSAPVVTNKIKNDYKPIYFTKPEQGGTLVIGTGNNPIKGAYNVDIKENIKIGVFKGDATNLVNVPTGSQAKVIIENPNGFDPLNPEILRVVKEGGEIEITGIKSNKEFYKIYSGKVEVPKGFEIIEVGEIPENFQKQGFRTDGKLIGTKNGEGFPKKTDKIIRIRKIKK